MDIPIPIYSSIYTLTYMYTHTQLHTLIHIPIIPFIYSHPSSHTHTNIHLHTNAHVHTHPFTHSSTHVHTHLPSAHRHAHTQTPPAHIAMPYIHLFFLPQTKSHKFLNTLCSFRFPHLCICCSISWKRFALFSFYLTSIHLSRTSWNDTVILYTHLPNNFILTGKL